MPLQKLQFRPGVVTDVTGYTNDGGWRDSNLVRFRFGFPQSVGGWEKIAAHLQFLGSCRSLLNWITLDGANLLGLGTNLKYYLERGEEYFDITPLRSTVTLSSPFTATSGLSTVNVFDTDHGCLNGDFVTFSGAVSLGGNITATVLNKEFQVTYIDANNYRITVAATANGSDTGNGGSSVVAAYQINTGLDTQVGGTGWGAGTFSTLLTYTLTNPITTTSTSATVTITHTSHGLTTGNYVSFVGASSVGGIPEGSLRSTFQVTVINANSYTITTVSAATSSVTGGGTVTAFYQNGSRAWGSAATVSTGNTLRLWSQDNYGEDLIYCVRNGGIYYWDAGFGLTGRGVSLSSLSTDPQTPNIAIQVMVSDRDRHVIALGSNYGGNTAQDPLIIRFSSQEDPFTWTSTATNTAGDLRLGSGSAIIRAVETKREIVVFTDLAAYSLQFIGPPYTFGLQQLAAGISVIGYNGFAAVDDTIYWMGKSAFYVYSGKVDNIPCPVNNYVFGNFNFSQADKVFAVPNSEYGEVTWYYPSANSDENDLYVTYNYADKVWTYGALARTAMLDRGVRLYPIGAGVDHYLYTHEYGLNDGSTTPPSPLNAYIESSPMDIGEGDRFSFVRRILPDVSFVNSDNTPQLNMILKTQNYPGSAYQSGSDSGIYQTAVVPIQQFTPVKDIRLRGRSVIFRIESDRVGTRWILGSPRLEVQPDGRR